MPDLSTRYMGLYLSNPLVAGASPLTLTMDGLRRVAEAGAGAVVLGSLFEEQIAMTDHFPMEADEYLDLVYSARKTLCVPVIASLNGCSLHGWSHWARKIESAGAHALELNLYQLPADPTCSAGEVEQRYLEVIRAVREQIEIPLAVKIGPFFSSPAHFARQVREAGADGLVLFNRFYQADFDLERMEIVPKLELSRSYDMLLPLTWVAVMHDQVGLDLALSGGVHTSEDALKAIAAGASAVQLVAELLQNGPGRLTAMRQELAAWLQQREYPSVAHIRGSLSQLRVADPSAFLRTSYLKTLQSYRPVGKAR